MNCCGSLYSPDCSIGEFEILVLTPPKEAVGYF